RENCTGQTPRRCSTCSRESTVMNCAPLCSCLIARRRCRGTSFYRRSAQEPFSILPRLECAPPRAPALSAQKDTAADHDQARAACPASVIFIRAFPSGLPVSETFPAVVPYKTFLPFTSLPAKVTPIILVVTFEDVPRPPDRIYVRDQLAPS